MLALASFQLAGRGRGANAWLSPAGCLQFSLLLRVRTSTLPASRLVFVQYLFALAVAEACREPGVLGATGDAVRVKWPNDLYVVRGAEKRKVGGILVNTSFRRDEIDVIIGAPHSGPDLPLMGADARARRVWTERAYGTATCVDRRATPPAGARGAEDGERGSRDRHDVRANVGRVRERARRLYAVHGPLPRALVALVRPFPRLLRGYVNCDR